MASIVVVCSVCRTSMKLGGAITESKKIRCTGCRTVIVLDPNPVDPRDPIASYPKKSDKTAGSKEKLGRIALYVTFGALCLFIVTVLFLTLRTPATRGAVEGKVTIDGVALKKGRIRFESVGGKTSITTATDIKDGRYSIPTATGPGLGPNTVKISTSDAEIDRALANVSIPSVNIKSEGNTLNFDPRTTK